MHFIDDRPDLLAHLEGEVRHRFLCGPLRRPQLMAGVVAVPIWHGVRISLAGRAGSRVNRLQEILCLETIRSMNIASRMTKATIAT